jgi:hypothetical protein
MGIEWPPKVKNMSDIFKECGIDLEQFFKNKNMENKEKTPYEIITETEDSLEGFIRLLKYMIENNLIIDVERPKKELRFGSGFGPPGRGIGEYDLVFKEKKNIVSNEKSEWNEYFIEAQAKLIKKQSELINMILKDLEEKVVHIPAVNNETEIKIQVIDIITKALQEAKIKTDGTK